MYNQALPHGWRACSAASPTSSPTGRSAGGTCSGSRSRSARRWASGGPAARHEVEPLDLGILVLVGLIAGPLTWDHYTVWALIPLVLIADGRRWSRCTGVEIAGLVTTIAAAIALLHVSVDARWASTFGTDFASQLAGGPYTLALLLLLGSALFLRLRPDRSDQQVPDETTAESGSTRYTAASSLTPTS